MVSTDDGATFGPPRRLTTSPFFNVSTLVRAPGLARTDGGIVLPAYHEFLGKFGEVLHLAPDGRITAKTRLSRGRAFLQPALVPLGPQAALAVLRAGAPPFRMPQATTTDGGRTWSRPVATPLPSADNAVAGVRLPDGTVLLVYNSTAGGRHVLSLAVRDGPGPAGWRRVHDFAAGAPGRRFSYPTLLADTQGRLHLTYTTHRRAITHVLFNAAWVRAAAGAPDR